MTGLADVRFVELADWRRVNPPIVAAFETARNTEHVRRTHSFHGRFENIYIPAEKLHGFQPLQQFICETAECVLGCKDLRHGFWFNEMQPGHRTSLHSHEELDELLSAVYYLTCPDDSGRLLLQDEYAEIAITPRPGLLVLFPPALPHEVEPHRGSGTRLSVAFNFGPASSAV